jgi:tetratricopeptide (TPR) repeat protein
MSLSRFDVAEPIYREALDSIKLGDRKNDRDIDLAMARGQLALLCRATGREVECAELCRESIRDYGNHAESVLQWFGASAYGELGLIQRAQGDFDDAFENLGEAVRRLENQKRTVVMRRYGLYQLTRGSVAERLNRDDDALQIYRAINSIKPEHENDREVRHFILLGALGCGMVLERQNRLEEALTAYEQFLERAKGWQEFTASTALFHNQRASVLVALGRYEEGCAAFAKLVELGSGIKDVAILEQVRKAEMSLDVLRRRERQH